MNLPTHFSGRMPQHIAIVMDGNNRWAKKRGVPGPIGHRAGADVVKPLMYACRDRGVKTLTLFAFSSENWHRSEAEVRALMALLSRYLRREINQLAEDGVRVRFIGRRDRLSPRIAKLLEWSEQATAHNTDTTLVLALDYGGRWDVSEAASALAHDVEAGRLRAEDIDETSLSARMSLADQPTLDLCIRTGGEYRLSNFLLWQSAYAELWFTKTLWPDFTVEELDVAIDHFAGRERRYGGRPAEAHS
ncbi:polyprenyl diphosphate synthase [Luminiphilus sp.]|nr:polyprenyl diphosphate synthase [Luminiphilus sp.]